MGVDGIVEFVVGLICGCGGNVLVIFVVEMEVGDYGFFDLCKLVFDLFDWGVEGCFVFGLLDVFVWIDWGVYKVGEMVYVQVLLCNSRVIVQMDLLLIFVVFWLDGVEYSCQVFFDSGLGGYVYDIEIVLFVQQGIWFWWVVVDLDGVVLVENIFFVEDYQFECVDFEFQMVVSVFSWMFLMDVLFEVKFLYGFLVGGQMFEGDVIVWLICILDVYLGYEFGFVDVQVLIQCEVFFCGMKIDGQGKLMFQVVLLFLLEMIGFYKGDVVMWLVEVGGCFVECSLDFVVVLDGLCIGICLNFDGGVDEGGFVDFLVIFIDEMGVQIKVDGVVWILFCIDW